MVSRIAFGGLVALISMTGASANAALVAYEGFDYADGTKLYSYGPDAVRGTADDVVQNGGTGWNGGYRNFNGNINNSTIKTPGLAYSDLPVTGGRFGGANEGFRTAARNFLPANQTSGTLYFSGLFGLSSQTNNQFFVRVGNLSGTTGSSIPFSFGINDMSRPYIGSGFVTAVATGTSALTLSQTHMLVAKVNIDTRTVDLFVDPTSTSEPAALLTHTFATSTAWTTGLAQVVLGDNGSANSSFDELRIGTTFADVVAVPEPTSIAMLTLGAVGALRRRR